MFPLLRRTGLIVALPLLFSGCALVPPPPDEDPVLIKLSELERRLSNIERVVQNQSLVNLTQQVNSLERQGDDMRGQVEELEYNASTTGGSATAALHRPRCPHAGT